MILPKGVSVNLRAAMFAPDPQYEDPKAFFHPSYDTGAFSGKPQPALATGSWLLHGGKLLLPSRRGGWLTLTKAACAVAGSAVGWQLPFKHLANVTSTSVDEDFDLPPFEKVLAPTAARYVKLSLVEIESNGVSRYGTLGQVLLRCDLRSPAEQLSWNKDKLTSTKNDHLSEETPTEFTPRALVQTRYWLGLWKLGIEIWSNAAAWLDNSKNADTEPLLLVDGSNQQPCGVLMPWRMGSNT